MRDLSFVVEKESIDEDILVIAGDNLIEFSLKDFYNRFNELDKNLIAVYDIKDIDKVRKRHGVVVLDGNRVVDFQEKPEEPKSTMKSICCYLFKPGVRGLLKEYLEEGNSDATGFFIEWLCKKTDVYSYDVGREKVWDVGNLESLRKVRERFERG